MEPEIKIDDFSYNLPEEKIAKYPLPYRDDSKILIFKDDLIKDDKFSNLAEFIPENSLMVFNNTKVVPARLFFRKESGAHIEIFCIEPDTPSDYTTSFESTSQCTWKCVIGNSKKWKSGAILFDSTGHPELEYYKFTAIRESNNGETSTVKFLWEGGFSFAHLMEMLGKVPIPPYLNRETEESDIERYQTVYARYRGSVAAPTAGLHFTDNVLNKLDLKGVLRGELSLHVGAGTFKPVKSDSIKDHPMHSEPFSVSLKFLRELASGLDDKSIVSVGTTSARTLESLYYIGVKCHEGANPSEVEQWEPYAREFRLPSKDAINALADWMESKSINEFSSRTRIIIVPGYTFRIIDLLITNFHQPRSTLLLLIAAFVGSRWREIYNYALNNDFRFLSYGDSSILFRQECK